MNILIIGCGYLGKAAGKAFQEAGHRIRVTTRDPDRAILLQTTFDDVVLWNDENYERAFQDQEVVLFCAASQSPEDYQETYLDNAKRIVYYGKEARQILYTSSTSIYGDHNGMTISELTQPIPLTVQSEILVETEKVILSHPGACIFRLGELVGPGRSLEARIRAYKGKPLPGTGENYTNFSPISDVIRSIQFAIEKPLKGIYNLCSDLHITRKELYERIAAARSLPYPEWDPSLPTFHAGNKIILSDKLKGEGFQFQALPWEGIIENTHVKA